MGHQLNCHKLLPIRNKCCSLPQQHFLSTRHSYFYSHFTTWLLIPEVGFILEIVVILDQVTTCPSRMIYSIWYFRFVIWHIAMSCSCRFIVIAPGMFTNKRKNFEENHRYANRKSIFCVMDALHFYLGRQNYIFLHICK